MVADFRGRITDAYAWERRCHNIQSHYINQEISQDDSLSIPILVIAFWVSISSSAAVNRLRRRHQINYLEPSLAELCDCPRFFQKRRPISAVPHERQASIHDKIYKKPYVPLYSLAKLSRVQDGILLHQITYVCFTNSVQSESYAMALTPQVEKTTVNTTPLQIVSFSVQIQT